MGQRVEGTRCTTTSAATTLAVLTPAVLTMAVLAAVLGGCSLVGRGSAPDPAPAGTGAFGAKLAEPLPELAEPPDVTGPAVASGPPAATWRTDRLPAPISRFVSCGDRAIYEAFVDGGLALIIFDTTSGELRHQVPIDRGSIPVNFVGHPAVSCGDGLVYGLGPEGQVLAVDLDTGVERWRTSAVVRSVSLCAGSPCGSQPNRELLFAADDGLVISTGVIIDQRALNRDESGFRLFPAGDNLVTGVEELLAYQDHDRLWTMPTDQIAAMVGHGFTPSTGWYGRTWPGVDTAVLYLGPLIDQSKPASQQVTAGGVVFAYHKPTGEVRWATGNVIGCGQAARIYCDFSGYSGGTYDITRISRLDFGTGEPLWSHPIDFRASSRRIGDVLVVRHIDDQRVVAEFHLDYETGRPVEPNWRYQLCSTGLGPDPDPNELTAFSSVLAEAVTWRPASFEYPCLAGEVAVTDVELIMAEPDLLDAAAHRTETGWYLVFDGTNVTGINPDGNAPSG